MSTPQVAFRLTLVFVVTALAAAGCDSGDVPDFEPAQVRFVKQPAPAAVSGTPLDRRQIVHQWQTGTCVVVVPEPPAYAYKADGTLKLPHEIHRPKAGEAHTLYLHFEGATVNPGPDNPDNFTSNIPWSPSEIPAFDHAQFTSGTIDTREKVIRAIRDWVQYFYAHNDLQVVTEQPPSGTQYGMMMVGGGPGDLGQPTGVLGISPFDCYKDDRNVSFTFSEDHGGSMRMLVQTIVHEAGHAYGLAHISNTEAIMNPTASSQEVYWGSGNVPDGAACDGGFSQDSMEMLAEMIGERDDTIPPWVEIYKPGHDAIVPSAFQALVHGTDNVVLYSVEFFVDGASIRKETLPEFAFQVSELPEGAHELWAVGEDAHGNTFTSEPINVEVYANCGALAECTEGLSAVGEPCESGTDCMTGLCAEDGLGIRVCGRICDLANDPCPWGTECVPTEADDASNMEYYCAGGPAPVRILSSSSSSAYDLSGCQSAPTPPTTPLIVLLALGLLALIRRRD